MLPMLAIAILRRKTPKKMPAERARVLANPSSEGLPCRALLRAAVALALALGLAQASSAQAAPDAPRNDSAESARHPESPASDTPASSGETAPAGAAAGDDHPGGEADG